MAPKRGGDYLGPGPRRGRRRVEEDPNLHFLEMEQHPPLEENAELTSDEEQTPPPAPVPRRARRKAEPRVILETAPQDQEPEEAPPAPAPIPVVPAQSTTTVSRDEFQAFMRATMETQAQMAQIMQTLATNQTTVQGTSDPGTTIESRYLKDFQRYKPPTFDGGKMDPIAAEVWLEAVETAFIYMKCPPEFQVHCGTYMLKGEAHFWWKGAQRAITPEEGYISWNQFKEAYLCKYYPVVARHKCQTAFLELKQGDKTVEDYDLEFNKLARFCPEYVSNEKMKIDRFIAGLRIELQGPVLVQTTSDYAVALRVATVMDMPRQVAKQNVPVVTTQNAFGQRRRPNRNSFRSDRQPRGRFERRGRAPEYNRPECPNCRKYHEGECFAGTGGCFGCGKPGHRIADCPHKRNHEGNRPVGQYQRGRGATQQARAVVHAITTRKAEETNTVVTGTLPILDHLAFTLFDSGTTHSFISEGFVKFANLELKPLEIPLTVSTPANEANKCLTATHRVRGGSVIVAGRKLVASLIVLCMQDFDVILGMDWLGEN